MAQSIDEILDNVGKLPASAQILPKLLSLLRDPDSTMDEVAALLKMDAPLTAQIIRISNSAYYGAAEPVGNIEAAVNRIGFTEVYKLVGAVVTVDLLGKEMPLYNLEAPELWMLSIACGSLMRNAATTIGEDSETAYTVGLLHGIGKVVLNNFHIEHGIEGYVEELDGLDPEKELEVLGFTHAQVGAALLKRWNFPKEIALPIENLFWPYDVQNYRKMAVLLALSAYGIQMVAEDPDGVYENFEPDQEALEELDTDKEAFVDMALDAQNSIEWLASTL